MHRPHATRLRTNPPARPPAHRPTAPPAPAACPPPAPADKPTADRRPPRACLPACSSASAGNRRALLRSPARRTASQVCHLQVVDELTRPSARCSFRTHARASARAHAPADLRAGARPPAKLRCAQRRRIEDIGRRRGRECRCARARAATFGGACELVAADRPGGRRRRVGGATPTNMASKSRRGPRGRARISAAGVSGRRRVRAHTGNHAPTPPRTCMCVWGCARSSRGQ